jgi:predicted transcriptional regulator of viral defense system
MATMKVWLAVTANIELGTNRVAATVTKIAEDGRVSVAQASRALKRLHEIGALQRLGRGRYRVNPHLAFRGALEDREAAASNVVPLKPREPA